MGYIESSDLLARMFDELRRETDPFQRLDDVIAFADAFGSRIAEAAVEAVNACRAAGMPVEEAAGLLGLPVSRVKALTRGPRKRPPGGSARRQIDYAFDASEIIERGLRQSGRHPVVRSD